MIEYFICILIMVIIQLYEDYMSYLTDGPRDTLLVLWVRITLWSILLYIFYRSVFYFVELGIDKLTPFF